MNMRSFFAPALCLITMTYVAFCITTQIHANNQIAPATGKFKLLTMLYNEKKANRCLEFITCFEKNLKHPSIDTIHVIYDTSADTKDGSKIMDYLKSKNITISYLSGRASYGDFFEIANRDYPASKIIICNADIYFNETLALLEPYDLRNKFLALTRWEVCSDGSIVEHRNSSGHSQDAWIFQTPLPIFENSSIKMGILGCDDAIAYQAQKSGLTLLNPSLSIQCCHLHTSEIRNYTQNNPYKKVGNIKIIPKCTVIEIDDNQRTLLQKHLRLNTGRREPIILN